MPYVVTFKNRDTGEVRFLGNPNKVAGISVHHPMIVNANNARRFLSFRAAALFANCNRFWECAVKQVEV